MIEKLLDLFHTVLHTGIMENKGLMKSRFKALEKLHDQLQGMRDRSKKRGEDVTNYDIALDALEDELMVLDITINEE